MEKLTNINQLTPGTGFVVLKGDRFDSYEFLSVHPHNDHYILAISKVTECADKLYIPTLLEEEVYFGKFDTAFMLTKRIEWAKDLIEQSVERIKDIDKSAVNDENLVFVLACVNEDCDVVSADVFSTRNDAISAMVNSYNRELEDAGCGDFDFSGDTDEYSYAAISFDTGRRYEWKIKETEIK